MQRFFWRNFFRFVVYSAAVALWLCIWWTLAVIGGVTLPWWSHIAGPAALHVINRNVLRTRAAVAHSQPMRRVYVGVVFTSLFGTAVLLINGAFWLGAAGLLALASAVGMAVQPSDAIAAAQVLGSAALLVVVGALAHGYGGGQAQVKVVELDVPLHGLDAAFDGFRLVQISDIHLGNYMDAESIVPYLDLVNELAPDLICITGDITDGVDHAPQSFPVLGRLRARHGVVATMGNHDVYSGVDEVTSLLRLHTSFRVLRNERMVIEKEGSLLHVLGVDDAGLDWARGVREHEALPPLRAGIPDDAAMILLSHRPDLFQQAVDFGIGLVLSGHTHGGQLALPFPRARRASLAHFMTAYPRGTFRRGKSTLHVNLGLGVTGQPVRVFSPREITLITLRQPSAQGD